MEIISDNKQLFSDVTLSQQLRQKFQSSHFSTRSLRRMMQFAEEFSDLKIVTPLVAQLTWTKLRMELKKDED